MTLIKNKTPSFLGVLFFCFARMVVFMNRKFSGFVPWVVAGVLLLVSFLFLYVFNPDLASSVLYYAGFLVLMCAGLFVVFLPVYVAVRRHHSNTLIIFLLVLLGGWSGIIWLIALVWAFVGSTDSSKVSQK